MDNNMEGAIQQALQCYTTCTETIGFCLEMGGKHAEEGHVNTMVDCAKACMVAADFMIRESEVHTQVCGFCADVCRKCAEECEGFKEDFMRDCADACRKCEASCRQMVEA